MEWTFVTIAWVSGTALGLVLSHLRVKRLALEERRVQSVMMQVQELSANVVNEIGKHASRLEEVNQDMIARAGDNNTSTHHAVLLDQLSQLVAADKRLQSRLVTAEQQLTHQAGQLNLKLADARLDALTSLPNQRSFHDELHRRFAEWQRTGATFALVVIELDQMHQVQEHLGPEVIDRWLQESARILDATMREMDLVARCGLAQFALLLPATRVPEATRAAERARQAIESKLLAVLGPSAAARVSAGVAESLPSDNGRTLFDRAEAALTVAKEAGGKCGYFHDGNSVHPIISGTPGSPSLRLQAEQGMPSPRNSHYAQYVAALNVDARTDALTGLPNRRAFGDELRLHITDSRKSGVPLSLMVVGIDNLPKLAAYHGQAAVDQLLRKLAQIVCAVVRETDLVTRYGWEEFAVILSGTGLHEARNAHERILTALAACDLRSENITEITLRSGFAELRPDDDAVSLTQRVDDSVQVSKGAGGRRVQFEKFEAADEDAEHDGVIAMR